MSMPTREHADMLLLLLLLVLFLLLSLLPMLLLLLLLLPQLLFDTCCKSGDALIPTLKIPFTRFTVSCIIAVAEQDDEVDDDDEKAVEAGTEES